MKTDLLAEVRKRADDELPFLSKSANGLDRPPAVTYGTCPLGDQFDHVKPPANDSTTSYTAFAVEMQGAAVAARSETFCVPWIVRNSRSCTPRRTRSVIAEWRQHEVRIA
jgi:nucleoside phosphorylase